MRTSEKNSRKPKKIGNHEKSENPKKSQKIPNNPKNPKKSENPKIRFFPLERTRKPLGAQESRGNKGSLRTQTIIGTHNTP
jgi:hypothetical protein